MDGPFSGTNLLRHRLREEPSTETNMNERKEWIECPYKRKRNMYTVDQIQMSIIYKKGATRLNFVQPHILSQLKWKIEDSFQTASTLCIWIEFGNISEIKHE